jgi:hypothetical protein
MTKAQILDGVRLLNGAAVEYRKGNLKGETLRFVRLPEALWRSAGKCLCQVCKGREGFWDTLAVPPPGSISDHAYTVHHPVSR